jgi:tyrosyl-tRNA synthetase
VLNPLIDGLDGTKMSSSRGNVITLTAEPADMYGKVMSMGDAQVPTYFELCTRVPMEEIPEILAGHPKEAKMRLAREIVTIYHGKEAAAKAEKSFTTAFSEGGVPENILTTSVAAGTKYLDALAGALGESKGEVRRLAEAGAITVVGGEVIKDVSQAVEGEITLKIGKHRFLKISIK